MVVVDPSGGTVWRSILFASNSPEYSDDGIMSFHCNAETVLNVLGGIMRILDSSPNVIIVLYADLGFL